MVKSALLSILSAFFLSFILSFCLNYIGLFYCESWWWSLVFFTVISICLKMVYTVKNEKLSFTELLLGTFTGKLLLSMAGFFAYSLHDKRGIFDFAVHFILHYILFTIFEIRYLIILIKHKHS